MVCGKHVGYGVRLLHLSNCGEHDDPEAAEEDSDTDVLIHESNIRPQK